MSRVLTEPVSVLGTVASLSLRLLLGGSVIATFLSAVVAEGTELRSGSSQALESSTPAGVSQGLTPLQKSELKKYGSLEEGKGNLLTPARGAIRADVKRVRDFIYSLIYEKAGAAIRAKGAHIVVNIYGQSEINAWVQQMNLNNYWAPETRWKDEHPNEIWPLRQFWGFPDDGQPIYEVAITTGLMSSLRYVDEVAMIIDHELTHLLEGHTDNVDQFDQKFQKWWSSQSHELVADNGAVDKMLGRFDLDAALQVIEKLHPKKEGAMPLSKALDAGVSSHHAEGVRLTALQYYIEYLRHTDQKAAPKKQIPIPPELKLDPSGRSYETPLLKDEKSLEHYLKLVDDLAVGIDPADGLIRPNSSEARLAFQDSPMAGLFGGNELRSFSYLLMQTVNRLESAPADKITKMNAFVKAMVFLGSRATSYYVKHDRWLVGLSMEDRHQLAEFLLRQTSGSTGWQLSHFKTLLDQLPKGSIEVIGSPFVWNKTGQQLLERLSKASVRWQEIVNYLASVEAFIRSDQIEVFQLGTWLHTLAAKEVEDTAFMKQYRQQMLESLTQLKDTEALVKPLYRETFPELLYVPLRLSEKPTDLEKQVSMAIDRALAPHQKRYQERLYQRVVTALNEQGRDMISSFYTELMMADIDMEALSDEKMEILVNSFDKKIQLALDPPLIEEQAFLDGAISQEQFAIVVKFMNRSAKDRARVLRYLHFLLVSFDSCYSFFSDRLNHLESHQKEAMNQLAQTLTVNEFWDYVQGLSDKEIQVRKHIQESVALYGGSNYRDLTRKASYHFRKAGQPTESRAFRNSIMPWERLTVIKAYAIPNLLEFLSIHGGLSLPLFQAFGKRDLQRLLSAFELAQYYNRFQPGGNSPLEGSQAISELLFGLFLRQLENKKYSDLNELVKTYERVIKLGGAGFTPTLAEESMLREELKKRIEGLSFESQLGLMRREALRKALGSEFVGQTLARGVVSKSKEDRSMLRVQVDKVLRLIPLREKWPDAYQTFRNEVVENSNLQPQELKTILSEDTRSLTQKAEMGNTLTRAMSSFSAYARALEPVEQIELIEFVMGRTTQMPKKLDEAAKEVSEFKFDLRRLFLKMREEIKFRDLMERSMVANSVLAGPNGLLATEAGVAAVKAHLLKPIQADNREITEIMFDSLRVAEGRNFSLFISYALAQKMETENTGLTENVDFRSFLDAYGAPGAKLAQYLAFVGEMKDLQQVLEDYQDAAMPISYYEALRLLLDEFGETWDFNHYRVVRLLGSGSVNIAIELLDLQTQQSRVVSIGRPHIVIKTKEDFRRFRLLLGELTRTPERAEKFGFIVGLMDIIEKSVTLEFDKQAAMKIQNQVQEIYRRNVDGWEMRSVRAESAKVLALFMEKAPGKTAKKILKTDPDSYASGMRAFIKVEFGVLRGVTEKQNWIPVQTHANPDIHDGQILLMIDPVQRILTVLDFGQTVPITNAEREFALDLMRIISKTESATGVVRLIEKHRTLLGSKGQTLPLRKVKKLFLKNDRMDIFVHFLSLLQQADHDVPLAVVHWILAANRLIKLGDKVGVRQELAFEWLVGAHKLGIPLTAINAGFSSVEKIRACQKALSKK